MTDGELLDTLLAVRRIERLGILLDDIPVEKLLDTFRADNIMDRTFVDKAFARRAALAKARQIISRNKFGMTAEGFAKRFLDTEECNRISATLDFKIAQDLLLELEAKGLIKRIFNRYVVTDKPIVEN